MTLLLVAICLALPLRPATAEEKEDAPPALPEEPVVSHLKWKGHHAVSKGEIEAVVFTRGPGWKFWKSDPEFSESALIGDMVRIQSLYQLHGYYEAEASYALEWNEEQTEVSITVTIDEGPPTLTESLDISIVGPTDLDADQSASVLEGLPLEPGERFSPKRYGEAKDLILSRMAELGYPTAKIEGGADVDVPAQRAAVEWRVRAGPLVHFGDVSVTGLRHVKLRTAMREVKFEPGERFSTSKLTRTRLALQRQGIFSWVSVQVQPPEADSSAGEHEPTEATPEGGAPATVIWPVEIKVSERPPYSIDFGVGYSSDESGRVGVGWRNLNFLGDARKLRLYGLWSGILSKAEIEFIQPYFFDPKLSLISRFQYRYETEPSYTANRVLPSIGLSRPIFGHWRGRITYEFSYNDITQVAPDVPIEIDEPEGVLKVGTIEFGFRRQTVDDVLDPTRGTWFDFVVAPTLKELGADYDYITYLLELRGYKSIGPTVLAGRFVIGSIQPIRGTTAAQVPLVSRFFAGGSNSHRGFRYHEMPPLDSLAPSVGGNSLLEGSIELRFPIWRKFGGVVFLDTGLLDLEPFTYPVEDLYWAIGPGFRYDTIVGPLRLDFGVLLNPRPTDDGRFQWFISVGQTF